MASPAGVILAVSEASGDRRPFPLDRPAHLVPLANRPLVVHILHALRDAALRRVAVVVDCETAPATRAAVGDGSAFGLSVEYVEQPPGTGPATALGSAFERVGDGPCVVHQGRTFLGGSLRPVVSDFSRRLADCVVLVGNAGVEPLGIDLCRPGVLDSLRARAWSNPARSSGTLSDALVDLAADGYAESWPVRAPAVRLDSSEGVLEASRLALDALEPDWANADLVDSRVEGRVVIAPSARLRSSVVRGPAVIGAGVELSHTYVGPYSVVGDRSRLEGAEIENSVLLPEVTIRSPGWRLEASVIGAGARISRGFELPAGVRLRVGDGALVYTA